MDDLKEEIIELGYLKNIIKQIYFSKTHLPLEESLLPNESDKDIHELISTCSKLGYVCLYVKHTQLDDAIANNVH